MGYQAFQSIAIERADERTSEPMATARGGEVRKGNKVVDLIDHLPVLLLVLHSLHELRVQGRQQGVVMDRRVHEVRGSRDAIL